MIWPTAHLPRKRLAVFLPVVTLLAISIFACGPGGPPRYDLSGKIEYSGKPVPAGQIFFEPDNSAENKGPRAVAQIQNGSYSTPPNLGTIGGPHRVTIYGSAGNAGPFDDALFPVYQTKLDIPKEPLTHDFVVPTAPKKN